MKFLSLAVASLLGLSSEGKKVVLDKEGLLRKAVRVDKDGRRLEGRRLDQDVQISYYESIQFSQCLSLKTYPDEDGEEIMFNELVDYTEAGQIVSEKSYVLFNVCKTGYCDYEDEASMYMTDLATYMQFLVEYLPEQHENYCKACEEAENYCLYYRYGVDENGDALEDDAAQEEEEEDEGDDRRRKLKNASAKQGRRKLKNGVTIEYVDCDTCEKEECFEDEDNGNDDEQGIDVVAEWAQEMAECKESESMFNNNYQLYSGFMCNAEGTGVEIGVFLDEECTLYTSLSQYANIMDYDDQYAYYNSQAVVTLPFTQAFDCSENIEYANPYDEDAEEEEEDDNGEEPEANEYCQRLFEEDTVDLDTCGANNNNNNNGDDDNNGQQKNYNIDWYSYVMDNEDAEDNIWGVCDIINNFEGEFEANMYSPDDSGTFYTYPGTETTGTNPGQVFGIILLVVAVVGVAIYVVMSTQKKKRDSKKVPLVSGKGALA